MRYNSYELQKLVKIRYGKNQKKVVSEKVLRRRITELNSRDTGILVSGLDVKETIKYRLSVTGSNRYIRIHTLSCS